MRTKMDFIKHAIADMAKREGLMAAYLHGSAAMGNMDAESDIDIALLADSSLSPKQRWNLRLRCIGFLMGAFPAEADKFDVVIFQDVPVLLRYNILRRGELLYERERSARIDFELSVERSYEDEEPYLQRETDMILRRIIASPHS